MKHLFMAVLITSSFTHFLLLSTQALAATVTPPSGQVTSITNLDINGTIYDISWEYNYLDLDRMQTFTTLSAAAQAAAVINNILNAENRDYLAAANSSIWFQNYMIPYDYDADTNKMYGWFSESFSGNWLGYPVVLTNVTRDNYALFSLISSPPKPPPPSPSESPPMTWLPLLLE